MQGNNIRGPAAEALGKMLRHNKSILRYFVALNLKAPITNAADDILKDFFLIFQRKQVLIFHVNRLLGRRFT